jgi:hypothetical protein
MKQGHIGITFLGNTFLLHFCGCIFLAATLLSLMSTACLAQETVSIGDTQAVLLRPAAPEASVILMPGGEGRIGVGADGTITKELKNQLVRTRMSYFQRGFAVLIVDADVDLSQAVKYMVEIKRPVTVIATSRGTLRAARGIADGARPDALVLTSGFLTNESGGRENVANILGTPHDLPPTLVIHHKHDGCHWTSPAGVDPFIRWAAGKARVEWLDGGANSGDPCKALGYHGFNGLDDRVVALAASFH